MGGSLQLSIGECSIMIWIVQRMRRWIQLIKFVIQVLREGHWWILNGRQSGLDYIIGRDAAEREHVFLVGWLVDWQMSK